MVAPKQRTERLLRGTRVQTVLSAPLAADAIFFGLMQHYAPDVRIDLYWPQDMANPLLTQSPTGVSLWDALVVIAGRCGVELTVNDYGSLVVRQPAHVEAMRHAVVVEVPALRAWQPVARVDELNKRERAAGE